MAKGARLAVSLGRGAGRRQEGRRVVVLAKSGTMGAMGERGGERRGWTSARLR